MAEKKTSKSTAKKAAPAKILSDKEIVLEKYPEAECKPLRNGYIVAVFDEKYGNNIGKGVHSGLAKTEQDAWKLAAHAVL